MRTRNNIELDEYGCFVKNDPSKKTDLDENLDSLQAPEDDLSAFGAFVKPQKEGLLRRAEAIRHTKADETLQPETEVAAEVETETGLASEIETPQTEETVSQTPQINEIRTLPDKENLQAAGSADAASEDEVALSKVKRPIGVKLILIISLLVLFSMGIITVLVSYFISKDTRINAEDNNLTINSRTASDCQSRLNSVISSAGILYDILISDSEEESRERVVNSFYERNKFIAAISYKDLDSISYNRQFFASNEIEQSLFEAYVVQESEAVAESRQGSVKLLNASPFFGAQTIAIFTPVYSGTQSDSAVILFACDELSESFANSSINSSTLVNDEGIVLVDPDIQQILSAADMSKNQLVAAMLSSKNNNEQFVYTDDEGTEYIAAFRKLGLGGCGVVTEVRSEIVLEAVNATTRRNLYLTVSILSLAIILIWFFSKSLSSPLKALTEVANEINRGNFNTEKFEELSGNRKDEIGVLIQSTKNEREILNTVTSLTNRGVTQAIVRKEIDFEPHLKDITIFFSDIRGFTAISDGFNKRFGEKSAAEIISFLNDYMGRMVNCINITGGNVDKFEGDAIMACWGVLRDDDLSFENLPDGDPEKEEHRSLHEEHVQADALSAIRATVAMRYALMEYNKQAEIFTKAHADEPYAKYKPHIRIGSGLNSGRATVGFMGSYHKMEFTSIGDAVNLASRTESSNKPCGTDILITQDTYDILKYNFIRCPENNYTISPEHLANEVIVEMIPVAFEVKGKGKQHFYGVVNMPGFDIEGFFRQSEPDFEVDPDCIGAVGPYGPKNLHEVRELLGIPEPNFDEVDLDAAEEKTKASGK
ncbi:adenylate/guanylate cyclase domain-containing protein [Treponema bryantii]|uniref:adenylate/guanylate cyclase domain-containing protein n=1 Tax=Treponema bryantii TaxID=163 RepID=UPI0004278F85|nr:adenylate/guanylate cyclase domain-containing protein [Treponema bryantii]